MLRNKLKNVHAVNMAQSGASTLDEIMFLLENRQPGARTDYILLNYVLNDIEDEIPAERRMYKKRIPRIYRKLFKYSMFLKHLYYNIIYPINAIADAYTSMLDEAYNDPLILHQHLLTVELLKWITEKLFNAELLVVLWPWMLDISYSEN